MRSATPLGLVPAPRFEARLGFAPAERVAPDPRRGLLRVEPMPVGDEAAHVAWTQHDVRDLAAGGDEVLGLGRSGFDLTRLDGVRGLAPVLDDVEACGALEEPAARAIRRALAGAKLPLAGGGSARILFVAPEGTIHRHAGPAGRAHRPELVPTSTTHHGPASNLHVDQDVRGTPLRQWMLRLAPFLFGHEAPDSRNARSRLRLVNLWIPLQQLTRPLVLLDGRTFDRRAHQALYALPVTSFLARRGGTATNDIWAVLAGEGQRYWFHGGLARGDAFVFDTLSAAHGSFVLPGETRVAALGDSVEACLRPLRLGDRAAAAAGAMAALDAHRAAGARAPLATSAALVEAARAMLELLVRVADLPDAPPPHAVDALVAQGTGLCQALVRRSIELRAVAWLNPG